jgi:hypothetical protein
MGAIRSTHTAAMETLLNLQPLDIFIKGEARMGAYRLKCNNGWRNLEYGHSRITNVITNPVLEMGSNYMLPKHSFQKPFDIQIDWEDWCHKEEQCLSKGFIWYTDGSKTDNGSGAGIHGKTPRHDIYVSQGQNTTIFHAEIYAIGACIQENLRRGYLSKGIHILTVRLP